MKHGSLAPGKLYYHRYLNASTLHSSARVGLVVEVPLHNAHACASGVLVLVSLPVSTANFEYYVGLAFFLAGRPASRAQALTRLDAMQKRACQQNRHGIQPPQYRGAASLRSYCSYRPWMASLKLMRHAYSHQWPQYS